MQVYPKVFQNGKGQPFLCAARNSICFLHGWNVAAHSFWKIKLVEHDVSGIQLYSRYDLSYHNLILGRIRNGS